MSTSEGLNSPTSRTLEDQQQQHAPEVAPAQDASYNIAPGQKPRVFKMSDEFLMFKFKARMKTVSALARSLFLQLLHTSQSAKGLAGWLRHDWTPLRHTHYRPPCFPTPSVSLSAVPCFQIEMCSRKDRCVPCARLSRAPAHWGMQPALLLPHSSCTEAAAAAQG